MLFHYVLVDKIVKTKTKNPPLVTVLQHVALHFRSTGNVTQCHHHFGKKKVRIIQSDQEICDYYPNCSSANPGILSTPRKENIISSKLTIRKRVLCTWLRAVEPIAMPTRGSENCDSHCKIYFYRSNTFRFATIKCSQDASEVKL